MTCLNNTRLDAYNSSEGVPCGAGKITVLQGEIESKKELVCEDCSTIIPNCLSCSNTTYCDLCQPGYQNAALIDAFNNTNNLCLSSFCGLTGDGAGCSDGIEILNCIRQNFVFIDYQLVYTCDTCEAGYYKSDKAVRAENGTDIHIYNCFRKSFDFSDPDNVSYSPTRYCERKLFRAINRHSLLY